MTFYPATRIAAALLAPLLTFSWVAPCAAQLPAVSSGSAPESLSTRSALVSGRGGFFESLSQQGIQGELWATGFHQDMFKGAGSKQAGSSGRADLMIDANTGKLGLWQGGGIHTHLTYRGGDLSASRGGALFPVHTAALLPTGGQDKLIATSLYLSQRYGTSTRVMLGKINAVDLLAGHPFFGGWGTDRFWNIAFVAPPSGVVPPVFMGGVFSHSFAPYSLTAMVFDPNDQTTRYSFNRLFADGVNASLGLSWSGAFAGRKSGASMTATYSTSEKTDWTQIGLPPGSQTTLKKGSYNVGVELSHLLVESAIAPGKGLGLYAKAGVADGNPNAIQRSFVGGLAGHAMVPGRPLDYFGLGYFYYDFSDQLQNAVSPVGSFTDEQGIEAYYTAVPMPWLRLTANLQRVNPATGANPSMWVGGLRARVAF